MLRYFLFATITLLTGLTARGCDCGDYGPFVEMAKTTPVTALIKVSKFLTFADIYDEPTPMSMEAEVIEVYKGNEFRKSITIWGDPGHLCRPYLSRFKVNSYYVIALTAGEKDRGQFGEEAQHYSISICGEFWLGVDLKKKTAHGRIDANHEKKGSIALDSLKKILRRQVMAQRSQKARPAVATSSILNPIDQKKSFDMPNQLINSCDDLDLLRQTELAWNKAIQNNDVVGMSAYMHEDWIIFSGDGKITTKKTFIDSVSSGILVHSKMDFKILRASIHDDTGLVLQRGTSAGTWNGDPFSHKELASTVYVRKHNVWLAVQTMIAPAG